MSFRELRNFTEQMRALGYPRLISMENFRSPNFELVADVLFWMVKRYDPDITVHTAIESEDDRVEFLTSIAISMQSKAGIKLNTKKLYAADGHAVKELLKVATTLYHASRYTEEDGGEEDADVGAPVTSRLTDVKAARSLASEITERGARLHDLLKAEMDVRTHRQKSLRFLDAISGNLESGPEQQWVEKALRGIVESTKDSVDTMKKQVQDFDADEKALVEKIKRKQTDLERNKKRLASLQHVRPAFMDEYEKLERDLQKQYEVYLERFRNLDYLEHELDSLNKAEEEKAAEADRRMKRMQRILREEELKIIRGEQDLVLGDENSGGGSGNKQIFGSRIGKQGMNSHAGLRDNTNRQKGGGGNVQGKMGGGSDSDSGSEDMSEEDLTNDDSESEDVSIGGSSDGGSSDSSNLIENDDGSDSSSDEGGGGGDFSGSRDSGSDDDF